MIPFTEEKKKYHRDWYHAHRDIERARRKKRTAKSRKFVHHILREIKLILGCKHCGYCASSHALDFHHRSRTHKSFTIGSYGSKHLISVLDEASKCDVLCANCHRIETHNERVLIGE